jgi:hypothetical protein
LSLPLGIFYRRIDYSVLEDGSLRSRNAFLGEPYAGKDVLIVDDNDQLRQNDDRNRTDHEKERRKKYILRFSFGLFTPASAFSRKPSTKVLSSSSLHKPDLQSEELLTLPGMSTST